MVSKYPSGSFSFDDPIVYQLFENHVSGIFPTSMDDFIFFLKIQTGKELTPFEIKEKLDEFLKYKETELILSYYKTSLPSISKNNLQIGQEINSCQTRLFFFQLRCFVEKFIFILKTEYRGQQNIAMALQGIVLVTQKFVDYLILIKKDSLKLGNMIEKWIEKGISFDYEPYQIIGEPNMFTRLTTTGISNMIFLFRQIEADAFDVLKKYDKTESLHCLSKWEADRALVIISQLARQANEIARCGLLNQNEPNSLMTSLFLSSKHFETVIQGIN